MAISTDVLSDDCSDSAAPLELPAPLLSTASGAMTTDVVSDDCSDSAAPLELPAPLLSTVSGRSEANICGSVDRTRVALKWRQAISGLKGGQDTRKRISRKR